MQTWLLVVVAVAALLVLAIVARRPRILLFPLIALFAAWSWIRAIIALPGLVARLLAAATLEKEANALFHHARTAESLWSAKNEFRPAAREIFARVVAGYGVNPVSHDEAEPDEMLSRPAAPPKHTPPGEDPYDAFNRASAAEAVTRSRGLKVTESAQS